MCFLYVCVYIYRPTGTYLRSMQAAEPLQGLQARQAKALELELQKMGFPKNQTFLVPTDAVCNLFDKLRADIVTMTNVEKIVLDKRKQVFFFFFFFFFFTRFSECGVLFSVHREI